MPVSLHLAHFKANPLTIQRCNTCIRQDHPSIHPSLSWQLKLLPWKHQSVCCYATLLPGLVPCKQRYQLILSEITQQNNAWCLDEEPWRPRWNRSTIVSCFIRVLEWPCGQLENTDGEMHMLFIVCVSLAICQLVFLLSFMNDQTHATQQRSEVTGYPQGYGSCWKLDTCRWETDESQITLVCQMQCCCHVLCEANWLNHLIWYTVDG